jgi:hypothetical protein
MQGRFDDVAAIRKEILNLLRQQMEALESPLGLSDDQLRECYIRQNRVQELREMLQSGAASVGAASSMPDAA